MKTVVSAASGTNNTVASIGQIVPKTEPISADEQATGMEFQTPNSSSTPNAKRPAFLDLKSSKNKRTIPSLNIDSPDLQGKTLNTPDLEKILLSSNLMQTPQPGVVFPTKGGPVTIEQEAFGKGFEEALQNLHTSKSSAAGNPTIAPTTSMTSVTNGISGGTFTYTNPDGYIKDEPQNTAVSPSVSPIDMETQEKIKLERKRQRNRVAASKCRKRKLERISKLEDRVKHLKGENTEMAAMVKTLKDHVAQLKQQVMEHLAAGCSVPAPPVAVIPPNK